MSAVRFYEGRLLCLVPVVWFIYNGQEHISFSSCPEMCGFICASFLSILRPVDYSSMATVHIGGRHDILMLLPLIWSSWLMDHMGIWMRFLIWNENIRCEDLILQLLVFYVSLLNVTFWITNKLSASVGFHYIYFFFSQQTLVRPGLRFIDMTLQSL